MIHPPSKVWHIKMLFRQHDYIYIYAFSRRFYPKRLTLTYDLLMCVPWELNPQPFVLLTQCSTTEPQELAQVCLRLATIKGYSKMCSFIPQHNTTDVARFEGACNWHADCRNVQSVLSRAIAHELNVHFSTISLLQRRFREIGSTVTTITSCCSMIMHGPMLQGSVCNSWKLKT